MLNTKNSIYSLIELGSLFSVKIRSQFIFLILNSLITSIFDVLSVASIIPFVGSLPGMRSGNQNYTIYNSLFSLGENQIIRSMLILTFFVLLASFTRIYSLHYANKLTAKFAHIISQEIFQARFDTSFEHLIKTDIKKSTAELVLYITKTVESLTYLSKFFTSLFIGILISLFLVLTKPLISIPTLILIGTLYILLGLDSRKKMNNLSKTIARYTENQIQIIQEIYGMSRNIYLDNSFKSIAKDYYKFDLKNKNLYALSEFLGSYPRYVIESLAIIIIALLTAFLTYLNSGTSYSIIPFLGAFAFASQRLLPAFQSVYSNWAGIKANDEFIRNIISTLKEKRFPVKYKISNRNSEIKKILFQNLSFGFDYEKNQKKIINNFSYEFNSGDRIAIIGKTGVGKSTLLDIISCLRYPSEGCLIFQDYKSQNILENKNKKSQNLSTLEISDCALIPQFNYVINNSMAKNISLSMPNELIDYKRIQYAVKISKLTELINNNYLGLEFNPTKDGYTLSGGQIQRLAIARAIYKMSPILLMDEATSALDKNTSLEIINNIFNLKHIDFVFAITHSSYYLDKFTHIIEFKKNGVIEVFEN